MAETMEMAILYQEQDLTLREIGVLYGVSKQTISRRFSKLEITRPGRRSPATLPPCARIDKDRLVDLYAARRLPVERIAKAFGVGESVIRRALRFHDIPKRRSIKLDGKHIDVIRRLKLGEPQELTCSVKHPYITLHKAAERARMKITVRKIEQGRFTVTRIG